MLSYERNAIFTLSLLIPGNNSYSIIDLIVLQAWAKYPESTAGLETSKAKIYVGGIGGLFIYSWFAIKSTVPHENSGLESWSVR